MKKLLVLVALLAATPVQAQGLFDIGNLFGPSRYQRPMFAPEQPRKPSKPKAAVAIQDPTDIEGSFAEAPGSIIIDNQRKNLYYVIDSTHARLYRIAVGKPSTQWKGVETVTRKAKNPTWYVPVSIQNENPDKPIPPIVKPGPSNPLGTRAIYLGETTYRIHGSNAPNSIGGAVSHGCFRMRNAHVEDLYERVQVGAKVYVR